ncbi:lysophospholipase [Massilia sp. H6]|uniref:alpha/beta hydrolase n=1 Tax=Massilia sp. H6 TaxID=2970464 RepID=UPI002168C128|nr:lysophospholipase [Massilia sp. H6]UVW27041.1 lysophospholipase [Massilia sp. H6]
MTRFRTPVGLALLLAFALSAHAGPLKDHQGRWLGDMAIPNGPTLKIGAEFHTRADGSLWASIASPDQGAYDQPVSRIREDGDTVELDLDVATLTLTWADDHFNGVFSQGDGVFAFALHRVAQFPRKLRAQTPTRPFPYDEQELAFTSADGTVLSATLSTPRASTRANLAVLVTGTGPATRDSEMAGHQHFAVMADYLARQGIAVLRYDKRGNGRSTGNYAGLTTAQLVDDLAAIMGAMQARAQFNRVGIVGLSEGPGIAAAVAARQPDAVDFIVSLAGVGMSGHGLLLLQDRIHARDNGASPAEVRQLMKYVRTWYQTIVAHPEPQPRVAALKALVARLPAKDRALIKKYRMDVGSLSLSEAEKPHLRTAMLSNTQADWRKVAVPVLALNGSLDHQVPARENLAGIIGALRAGGNRQVESAVLPSLNHLFQTAKTGNTDEYDRIEETIAPIALARIAAFVKKQD